jgi:hypothetical protein
MKKLIALVFIGLLMALPAWADEVDDGLPQGTDAALKAQTRAMIQAGVESDDALRMTRAMLQNRFERRQIIQAQEAVMAALKQGCPAEPVMNKAYEGMMKQVAAERVVQAMQQVQLRYAAAYRNADTLGLGTEVRNQVGNRLAEGMAAGLEEEDAARIMQQIRIRTQTMAQSQAANDLAGETAATTRDLARLGASSEDTAEMVCQALQHNYQAKEMIRLRRQFRQQVRLETPRGLAQRYTKAFRNGQDPAGESGSGTQSGQQGSMSHQGGGSGSDMGSGSDSGSSGGSGSGGGSGGSGHGGKK